MTITTRAEDSTEGEGRGRMSEKVGSIKITATSGFKRLTIEGSSLGPKKMTPKVKRTSKVAKN